MASDTRMFLGGLALLLLRRRAASDDDPPPDTDPEPEPEPEPDPEPDPEPQITEVVFNLADAVGQPDFEPLEVRSDPGAIGGDYVVAEGGTSRDRPPQHGRAQFTAHVPAGDYHLWLHARPFSNANSWWVIIDGKTYRWHGDDTDGTWRWEQAGVHRGSTPPSPDPVPVPLSLSEGQHEFVFAVRESDTHLDQAILTNDLQFAPE